MSPIRKRYFTLAAWVVVAGTAIALGPNGYFVYPLITAIGFEVIACLAIWRLGTVALTRTLLFASSLSVFAATLLLVPELAAYAIGDSAYTCWGDDCDPREGTNLIGVILFVALPGLFVAFSALVYWIGYFVELVDLVRQRPRSAAS